MAKIISKNPVPTASNPVASPVVFDQVQEIKALVERYKRLEAKYDELTKVVLGLEENQISSKNWQAILVNRDGLLLIVRKSGDTDGDGHISQKEAIAAANAFIVERGLSNNYKASALPTW